MERIKIAHIITDLDVGGAEMMLLRNLRNLKGGKYTHFVISLKPAGSVGRMIEREGVKVYSAGFRGRHIIRPFIRLLFILRRERPRVAHNYLFHADIAGRLAAKAAGVPIVVSSLRSVDIGGRLREKLLRITDFCVNRVTAVSRAVKDAHVLKGTIREEKARVIYNGVEFAGAPSGSGKSLMRAAGAKDGVFILLAVGRLSAVKGHIFLLAALDILKRRGREFMLLIAGRGEEEEKIKSAIVKLALSDRVALLGERNDILELLSASDAFVLPSLWEGMPNALLEAMAAGLPVVATKVGGITEAVRHNENGILVAPKDKWALADAIELVLGDGELRRRLARSAADSVKQNFDIKNTAAETEKLYEELLS